MLSIVHSDEKWDLSEQFIYNWRIVRVWFSAERFGHSSPAIWSRVRQAEQTARAYLPFPGSQTFTYAHVYTRLHAQTCATIRISLSPQNDSAIYIGAIKPEKNPKQHLKRCSVLSTYQETTSQSSSSSLADLGWRRMTLLNGIAIFNPRGLWDRVGVIPTERFTL